MAVAANAVEHHEKKKREERGGGRRHLRRGFMRGGEATASFSRSRNVDHEADYVDDGYEDEEYAPRRRHHHHPEEDCREGSSYWRDDY